MKKLPIFLLICLLIGIVACKETEDYWTQYEQWRETNESWFIEQLGAKDEKGNPIYTKVVPILQRYEPQPRCPIALPNQYGKCDIQGYVV